MTKPPKHIVGYVPNEGYYVGPRTEDGTIDISLPTAEWFGMEYEGAKRRCDELNRQAKREQETRR